MSFIPRHVANLNKTNIDLILKQLNLKSVDELVKTGVKSNYNVSTNKLKSYSETQSLENLKKIIDNNKPATSFFEWDTMMFQLLLQ